MIDYVNVVLLIIVIFLLYQRFKEPSHKVFFDVTKEDLLNQQSILENKIGEVAMRLQDFSKMMNEIPSDVLKTIKGSTNSLRGDLGEFIQYTKLKAAYDRIIPLGDVMDYLCIQYPDTASGREGSIDFIEVKTNNSRLNNSQKMFRDLVAEKKIGFKKVKIQLTDDINDNFGERDVK